MSRHARHIALAQVGADGQQKITDASVLLIGVGGIGCAAASYLVSSGVGHVTLNDFDTVDETNLGRQVLFGPEDLGQLKADVAARKLAALNPDIRITSIRDRLDAAAMVQAIEQVDVVLDGSDNFATRFLVNDACVSVSPGRGPSQLRPGIRIIDHQLPASTMIIRTPATPRRLRAPRVTIHRMMGLRSACIQPLDTNARSNPLQRHRSINVTPASGPAGS